MQCRICFEEGDTTSLVAPCACRGTSSYIHRTCLDQYIRYYPDRTCRVCHETFPHYVSPREGYLYWIVLFAFVALLVVSSARLLVKIALLGAATVLSSYFLHRNLFSTTPVVFLLILACLFLPGGHPSAVYLWLAVLGAAAFSYTLAYQLPMIVLLVILVTSIVAAYTGFLVLLAYTTLDSSAFTVFLSLVYLAWYGWVHDTPLRLRLA
jgi:hypothetical protein